jgi:hypothetical protein
MRVPELLAELAELDTIEPTSAATFEGEARAPRARTAMARAKTASSGRARFRGESVVVETWMTIGNHVRERDDSAQAQPPAAQ